MYVYNNGRGRWPKPAALQLCSCVRIFNTGSTVEGGSVNMIGVSRSEKFLEKRDTEKPGGDAGLSPRLVGICRKRKRAAIFPPLSFRDTR
jgi:hypothetical protein